MEKKIEKLTKSIKDSYKMMDDWKEYTGNLILAGEIKRYVEEEGDLPNAELEELYNTLASADNYDYTPDGLIDLLS